MPTPIVPPFPYVKRRSSAGCLAGCVVKVLGALVFGCLVVLVVYVIVAPWAFYLGGQFHPLAYWQGFGIMHGPGGDYAVLVWISPRPGGRGGGGAFYLSGPSVGGSGIVCTPHGERYNLRLTGSFTNKLGLRTTDTNGQPIGLTLSQRLNFFNTNSYTRLSFSLHGTWQNPNLVVDDRGTLSQTFNPDGTWTPGDRYKHPKGEPIPLTLHPGSGSDFDTACAAVKK
jgi:hypothetical protein